ncbi:hypothetical protein [Novosphingobium sp. CECT 9465]|uniref:hypothetical protein n=1 Tax=Novosphingobium sp. CECT 9465 TaxID=2829794 RepID=UPI001E48B53F|nr:hypothetical protein [Novosphingobium sp. CECT 9465]CAH0496336.1 hypothetical protein NVSP9465_01367 [Novosphingobium sp. CECT 9465]
MSRLKTLTADPDEPAISIPVVTDPVARGPRIAADIDQPFGSPVHALQEQLQKIGDVNGPAETAYPFAEDKAPGWVRMGLPIALSVVLWTVILRVTGVLG